VVGRAAVAAAVERADLGRRGHLERVSVERVGADRARVERVLLGTIYFYKIYLRGCCCCC